MNLSSNYTGTGALLSTDTLVFNNSSIIAATATADLSVYAIITLTTYTGAWSISGATLTLGGNFILDGTGTLNLGDAVNVAGNNITVHIGTTVGTVTASSCLFTISGDNNTLDIDKSEVLFKQFILAANRRVLLTGSGITGGSVSVAGVPPVILGDHCDIAGTGQFTARCGASTLAVQLGAGARISTIGSFFIGSTNTTDSIVITVPPLTMPKGKLYLSSRAAGYGIFRLSGDILTNWLYTLPNSTYGSAMAFETNNHAVVAKNWSTGSTRAGAYVTNNVGSSNIRVNSYNGNAYPTDSSFLVCNGAHFYWSYSWINGTRQRTIGTHTFQHHNDLFMGHSKVIDYSDTVWSPAYYYHRDYQHGYYINRAVSGHSVIHCNNRIDSCLQAFTPRRFFLWYGGNGLATTDSQTFIDTVASYMSAFSSVISKCNAAGVDSTYIIGLAPYDSMNSSQMAWQTNLNKQIIDSCAAHNLFYIDAWAPLVKPGTTHDLIDSFTTDGKHPNSTIAGAAFCGYLFTTATIGGVPIVSTFSISPTSGVPSVAFSLTGSYYQSTDSVFFNSVYMSTTTATSTAKTGTTPPWLPRGYYNVIVKPVSGTPDTLKRGFRVITPYISVGKVKNATIHW